MTTFYRHRSRKDLDKGYIPLIDECTPHIEEDNDGGFRAYVSGVIITSNGTRQDAIESAENHLKTIGWTTNRVVAEKRAAKEIELRKSGRLRSSGKNFNKEEADKCAQEIMSIKD
jgi:hypothetical protein